MGKRANRREVFRGAEPGGPALARGRGGGSKTAAQPPSSRRSHTLSGPFWGNEKQGNKIPATHSLTWPRGVITLHAHPCEGPVPSFRALDAGGLNTRVGAPVLRTFFKPFALDRRSSPLQGKATDPWASSRSASSASSATSSAGLRLLVRLSAFPVSHSAAWGSRGGPVGQQSPAATVMLQAPTIRMMSAAVTAAVAAAVRNRFVLVQRANTDAAAGGLVVVGTRRRRNTSVPRGWSRGQCWLL